MLYGVGLWKRMTGWVRREAVEREEEEEQMSPEERRIATEGVENLAADQVSEEHLGAFDPESLEE